MDLDGQDGWELFGELAVVPLGIAAATFAATRAPAGAVGTVLGIAIVALWLDRRHRGGGGRRR